MSSGKNILAHPLLHGVVLLALSAFMAVGAYVWNSERQLNKERYEAIHGDVKENKANIKRIEKNQQDAALERREIKTKQSAGAVEWNLREARVIETAKKLAEVDKQILAHLAQLETRQTVSEATIEANRQEWERRAVDIKNHKH